MLMMPDDVADLIHEISEGRDAGKMEQHVEVNTLCLRTCEMEYLYQNPVGELPVRACLSQFQVTWWPRAGKGEDN